MWASGSGAGAGVRLVYPMWTIDVGAEGEIGAAEGLADELMGFDPGANLTWVVDPLAAKRWCAESESPWLSTLCSFRDRHGSTANVVLHDAGDESRRVIQRLHDAGFPVVMPAPGSPYYVEVLRPGGWIAGSDPAGRRSPALGTRMPALAAPSLAPVSRPGES